MFASQMRFTTPALDTAASPFGAAGANVSFGVMQIGLLGSLSIIVVPTAATLRTTKHCSFPAPAPAWVKVCSAIGLSLSGAGAGGRSAVTPVGVEPAAGTA